MIRNGILALAILVTTVTPVQALDTQGAGRGLVPMPPIARPGNKPPSHHPLFNHRPFFPYGGIGAYAPPESYGPYVTYVPVPVYESPVAYSQPAGSMTSSESGLPPMPSVVPYPTGETESRRRTNGFGSRIRRRPRRPRRNPRKRRRLTAPAFTAGSMTRVSCISHKVGIRCPSGTAPS